MSNPSFEDEYYTAFENFYEKNFRKEWMREDFRKNAPEGMKFREYALSIFREFYT